MNSFIDQLVALGRLSYKDIRVVCRFAKILAGGPPQAPGPAKDFADNSY
jgi:hypothetical protein